MNIKKMEKRFRLVIKGYKFTKLVVMSQYHALNLWSLTDSDVIIGLNGITLAKLGKI